MSKFKDLNISRSFTAAAFRSGKTIINIGENQDDKLCKQIFDF